MRAALKQLGFDDTYHMMALFENPMDNNMWIEAYEAKYFGKGKPFGREEWDQLLGHCQVKYRPYEPSPTTSPQSTQFSNPHPAFPTTPTPPHPTAPPQPNKLTRTPLPPTTRPSATSPPPPSSRTS